MPVAALAISASAARGPQLCPRHLVKPTRSRYDMPCHDGSPRGVGTGMIDHHEHDIVKVGSERSFGVVFAAVFLIVALWPIMYGGGPRWWALGVTGAFAIVTLARPALLSPLNLVWFRFGILLGRIVGPVVMGVIFFVAVTPTALVFRLRRKDLLDRRPNPAARTYWVARDESLSGSMSNQF